MTRYIRLCRSNSPLNIEGKDPQVAAPAIQKALQLLEVPQQLVTHKPIAAIYLDATDVVLSLPKEGTEDLAQPKGRNQTQKSKCKTQNFGFPASRDNSLLFKKLRQLYRKNTHKKQEVDG